MFFFRKSFYFRWRKLRKIYYTNLYEFFRGISTSSPNHESRTFDSKKNKLGNLMKKPCITCTQIRRKWEVNLRQPWLSFFWNGRDACVTQKARKIFFLFLFTNHGKEKAKQFMMMLGDHEAAHFVQVVAVMQFFTKNKANLVKITATWKWLAHSSLCDLGRHVRCSRTWLLG